jgi:hypothetical protein
VGEPNCKNKITCCEKKKRKKEKKKGKRNKRNYNSKE